MSETEINDLKDFLNNLLVIYDDFELKKSRGFNDYNIFSTLRGESEEVGLHSRFIHSLLDPTSKHYQKTLFLEQFIKACDLKDFSLNFAKAEVKREKNHIDIYITDDTSHIIIENKIRASDRNTQIQRYIEFVAEKAKVCMEKTKISVLYLTPFDRKPLQNSLGDFEISGDKLEYKGSSEFIKTLDIGYKNVTYKNEILNWLDSSLKEVSNLTNLSVIISQYINLVNKICNKGKEMNAELVEIVKDNYELINFLNDNLSGAKNEIMKRFLGETLSKLDKNSWKVKIDEETIEEKRKPCIKIYKSEWNDCSKVYFALEMNKDNYIDPYIAFICENLNNKELCDFAKKEFEQYSSKYKQDLATNCVIWKWLDNSIGDYILKIINNKNASEILANLMVDMITDFEKTADEIYNNFFKITSNG